MTTLHQSQVLIAREEIVAPPAERACNDHNFGLPTGIYIAMVACFAGAIAVLASAFSHNLGASYAVIFALLIAFFGVPTLFVKASPSESAKPLGWYTFAQRGIITATGRTGASEATILVLMLPVFILGWAIAVATIAALVS